MDADPFAPSTPASPETPLQAALAPLRSAWLGLSLRDRRAAMLAGAVLGLFLVWSLAVQPAWRTLATAPAEIDAVDVQLQGMQRLAAEATELRATPPIPLEQATAALQAATERLGDQAKLAMQGERAVLTLTGVGTSAFTGWLAEARAGARARPVEATLNRGPQGYNGTLVVSLGGGS
jgi:general secretion pathway protein M